jgi:hypothetical protein
MKNKYLHSLTILALLLLSSNFINAQLGVNSDNTAPNASAMLDVKSSTKGILIPRVGADLASPTEGLLYYNTTGHNFRYYDGTAWQAALFGNQWNVNGSKISYSAGNVGIGVADPLYKLDVNGDIHLTGSIIDNGIISASNIGLGTISPNYRVHIFDGSVGFYNTNDNKTWSINYNETNNGLQINENGSTSRLNIENGGNVGIGIINPAYKLDVDGAIRASGNIQSLGSASIEGTATVNSGKGVAYNQNSSTNLKIATFTTANFHAVLGPHASAVTSIGLPAGFSSAPHVFVGNIAVTGGVSGELYRVILVLYNCSNTACDAKIINTDNSSVDYNITWDCMAVGN